MADNEASVGLELGVGGGIFPANAKLAVSLKRGWNSRGQEVLDSVSQAVDGEVLERRLLKHLRWRCCLRELSTLLLRHR